MATQNNHREDTSVGQPAYPCGQRGHRVAGAQSRPFLKRQLVLPVSTIFGDHTSGGRAWQWSSCQSRRRPTADLQNAQIGGDQQRHLLVELTDQIERFVATGLLQRRMAKFPSMATTSSRGDTSARPTRYEPAAFSCSSWSTRSTRLKPCPRAGRLR